MTGTCEGCIYANDPMGLAMCINCKRYYNFETMNDDNYKPKNTTDIIFCRSKVYEFSGMTFEYGPMGTGRLKKDGELYKRDSESFLAVLDRFAKLSKEDREKYRVGGGCQHI